MIHDRYNQSYISRETSDNLALILKLQTCSKPNFPFRMLRSWLDRPGFAKLVRKSWDLNVGGSVIFQLWRKGRRFKNKIKSWLRNQPTIEQQITSCVDLLNIINSDLVSDPTNNGIMRRREEMKIHLLSLIDQEEQNLTVGDSNSTFFNQMTKVRTARNSLQKLRDINVNPINSMILLDVGVVNYYENLFEQQSTYNLSPVVSKNHCSRNEFMVIEVASTGRNQGDDNRYESR